MKTIFLLIATLVSLSLFAQSEGAKMDVDSQVFTFQRGFWIHDALPKSFDPIEENTAVYRRTRWSEWYDGGTATLKKILDLGPNVIFYFPLRGQVPSVHWVVQDDDMLGRVLAGGAAAVLPGLAAAGGSTGGGLSATAVGVGGAVLVGGVIVANNKDDDNATDIRPKNRN